MEKLVEKRAYPRIKRNLPIEIIDSVNCKVLETKDISSSGLYCEVDKEIPLMTKVGITLMLALGENEKRSEKKVDCKGIIVRSDQKIKDGKSLYDIAIFFDEISEKNRLFISKFIEDFLQSN